MYRLIYPAKSSPLEEEIRCTRCSAQRTARLRLNCVVVTTENKDVTKWQRPVPIGAAEKRPSAYLPLSETPDPGPDSDKHYDQTHRYLHVRETHYHVQRSAQIVHPPTLAAVDSRPAVKHCCSPGFVNGTSGNMHRLPLTAFAPG